MEVLLWVLQGALAVAIGGAGLMKLVKSRRELATRMAYVEDFTDTQVKLIGGVEVAAALGVVLPAATGILPTLTPIAAVGIILLMLGAMATHIRRREFPALVPNIILALMAAVVAWGRFGPYAIT